MVVYITQQVYKFQTQLYYGTVFSNSQKKDYIKSFDVKLFEIFHLKCIFTFDLTCHGISIHNNFRNITLIIDNNSNNKIQCLETQIEL